MALARYGERSGLRCSTVTPMHIAIYIFDCYRRSAYNFAIQHINRIYEYLILFAVHFSMMAPWPCAVCTHDARLSFARIYSGSIRPLLFLSVFFVFPCPYTISTWISMFRECPLQLQSTFTHAAATLNSARMHTKQSDEEQKKEKKNERNKMRFR